MYKNIKPQIFYSSNYLNRIKYETIDFIPKPFFYTPSIIKFIEEKINISSKIDYKQQYETRDF